MNGASRAGRKEASMSALHELPSLHVIHGGLHPAGASDGAPATPTRQQLAVVRALADEVERCVAHPAAARAMREQLAQELARLGCRSLEAAASMAANPEDAHASGVYAVAPRASNAPAFGPHHRGRARSS
jgi:hypothetical protein